MHRPLLTVALVLLMMAWPSLASADDGVRRDLRVLFVGPNPDDPAADVGSVMEHYHRAHEIYARHTESFRALLEEHFDDVTVVHGSDYRPSMSADVDVTIFDAQLAQPLPRDFGHASIFIGYVGPNLTDRQLGTKLDWL